jgi:hypothetical protein
MFFTYTFSCTFLFTFWEIKQLYQESYASLGSSVIKLFSHSLTPKKNY